MACWLKWGVPFIEMKAIVVDAVNTVIHKPALWEEISSFLKEKGLPLEEKFIKERHRLVSEVIHFPDRTDKGFYLRFNEYFFEALGIAPELQWASELFERCSYLPWQAFDDASYLNELQLPVFVLSNFNATLSEVLASVLPVKLATVVTSEELGVAKPSPEFFSKGIARLGFAPTDLVYVGDSIRLDVMPGAKAGMRSLLIDRNGNYPTNSSLEKVSSFAELL